MLFGNGIYAVCQWSMLAVVAKIGTTDMVGRFALAQTITIPIYSFTNLQLRSVLATDTHRQIHYFKLSSIAEVKYLRRACRNIARGCRL